MAATAKLTLLLKLKNKLDGGLMKAHRKLSKTTDKMKGKFKQLKLSGVEAFTAMRNEVPLFGRAMDLLGNPYALITAGLLSVGILFGKATSEAKKFNHEFLAIKNLNLDKNQKDLKTYKGLIMDSAFETGKSLVDSTKAYYDIQSATGLYGKEAKKVFTSVANYSTATGASLNDSVNSVTKAMKAFNLTADDTGTLLTSNAKAVQIGITTFDQLAKVQTQFGGSAGNIGQSVDTANKLFGAFTAIGGTVAEASTLTKTFFQGLAQRGKQIEKELKIKVFDDKGNFRQADAILKDIGKRFKNLSQQEVAALISKIGGPDGLNQMLFKMKGNSADVIKTFEAFDSSKFNLDKALKNAQGDVTVLGDMVKNRFNVVMAKLGEKILPLVLRVIEKLNVGITWVYNNFDLLEDIVESLAIGFGVLGARLLFFKGVAIASAIASGGLTGALGLVTGALHAVKFAIFSIPIVGWILAAVTALVLLYKRWDKFRAFIKGFGEIAKLVIGKIANGFAGLGKIISGIWNGSLTDIKQGVKDVGNAFVDLSPVGIVKDGRKYAKAFKGGYDAEMKKSAALKIKKANSNNLLADDDASTTGTTNNENGNNTDYGVGKVTAAASSAKSIVIEKIIFHQGEMNVSNKTLNHKTPEEFKEWYDDQMMKVVRNAEMS